MSETIRYRGFIQLASHGDAFEILFLGCGHDHYQDSDPLADQIQDDIADHGSYLSVRYWTADAERDDDAMIEGALRELLGEGEAKFGHRYSEITGYLWTDEDIEVGGHDLLEELCSQQGRYCLLEITYSREECG